MILRGVTCLTMDRKRTVIEADIRIDRRGRIAALLPPGRGGSRGEEEVFLPGRIAIPGLVQTHVHLCQTIMRGLADRLPLSLWLRSRIWPLEAAHDASTVEASAALGLLELATGGTTAILDMGTTRHTEAILRAAERSGLRVVTGTALMDEGRGVPRSLLREVGDALAETERLLRAKRSKRVGLCLAPRFIPSVSERGWRAVVAMARRHDLLIHTHACETRTEVEMVRRKTGSTPFVYLDRIGAAGRRLRAAHAIWLSAADRAVLKRTGSAVVHCPGSNAKLGSGTADVRSLRRAGVPVGIGCDGAACNNRLDLLEEMRRAASAIAALHGPAAVDPSEILAMGTIDGARLLGMEQEIGSIEPGKAADLTILNPAAAPGMCPSGPDPHGRVLYGAGREHVEQVWVEGRMIVKRGRMAGFPAATILRDAGQAAHKIQERMEARCRSRSR